MELGPHWALHAAFLHHGEEFMAAAAQTRTGRTEGRQVPGLFQQEAHHLVHMAILADGKGRFFAGASTQLSYGLATLPVSSCEQPALQPSRQSPAGSLVVSTMPVYGTARRVMATQRRYSPSLSG